MVTPTHMRHFKHGRCDPTYSTTVRSHQLVTALASCIGPDKVPRYTNELFRLFHLAFLEHKILIKATKLGLGVGPHLAALRRSMSEDNALKKFLDPFRCPSVYLTGSDLMEGFECTVGNVYGTDQLAVTYLGRKDKVRIVLNGKGTFANILGNLKETLELNLKLVMLLALRYAIAGQMGAIECLLQDNEEKIVNGSSVGDAVKAVEQKGHKTIKPDFTLVIHGGAGEEMMLNQKVIGTIEFALQTALTLGAQVLFHGGSSLDAVQRSVVALEDCFLFNAGKGSVYNRDGEHEMEATIMDGHGKNSGSVACLRRVKNPIKAARCVMEKSAHSLLIGEGAEEFLGSLGEKETKLKSEYFDTDIRYKELLMKCPSGDSKNNHPQTVGAVALDKWGKLAAATSTGGLVGKWKGRVGDTAIVGAGIYADGKLAVTCSGDADCKAWKQKNASKVKKVAHVVVLPKEEKLETNVELPGFNPFMTRGTISLSVDGNKRHVSVLRDTGSGQSLIRKGVLPFSAETYTGTDVLVRGIELGCVKLPIHSVYLDSDLVTGTVNVGVCEKFPVDEVDVILGNDLAGGKVFPSPIVSTIPVCDSQIPLQFPGVFPVCAVTRSQARNYEDLVDLSDTFLAHSNPTELALSVDSAGKVGSDAGAEVPLIKLGRSENRLIVIYQYRCSGI
ncbi:Isoaspartyl peptidase [Labeo rohita]|uniref:Isoaspartyl peptidase n=1 Tax=Labeo rohita TaxID=84645 RepID=A0A498NZ78_LABRO|nr:Isoaspartyl peptidase [Labeo rohita]